MSEKQPDSNIELMKIQIYSERCHARLASMLTFVFTLVLGFLVLFYTLFYEKAISPESWGLTVVGLVVALLIFLYFIYDGYEKELKKISKMMEDVKEGKELPTLEKLLLRKPELSLPL